MATVSNVNGQLRIVYPNKTEYYQFPKLSNLSWVLNDDGFYYILFTYEDDYFVKIKLLNITNQPTWTNTQPGAELAVNTIASWIGTSFSTSLLATEATLLNVLTAVDNMRDYEVRLVQDSATPNVVTWLEVRYWDAQSGTLGAPQYYLPGSSVPGSPVLPITYVNNQNVLLQILAELQGTLDVNITNATLSVTQSGTWTVTSNQGTSPWVVSGTIALDSATLTALENITVQNGAGAAAVNIQDGGNSITVDGTVAATQSGTWNISSITGPVALPTGAATEITLSAVNTKLTSVVRTPTFLRPTGINGTVAAGTFSMSFASVGTADALVGTIILKPGETINFDAGALNNALGAVAYDTLTNVGAELIIITLT